MKKLILTLAIVFASGTSAFALPGFDMGVFGGLSTPNDKIAEVYTPLSETSTLKLLTSGVGSGFHIGAKIRVGLADRLNFVGSIACHHIPATTTTINTGITEVVYPEISTTHEIIPFTAGINYNLVNLNLFKVYAVGDIAYNYFTNSVDIPAAFNGLITASKEGGRVGAGVGVGFDFDLKVMKFGLEGKYNFSNIIGKVSGEPDKNYLSVSLGVYL